MYYKHVLAFVKAIGNVHRLDSETKHLVLDDNNLLVWCMQGLLFVVILANTASIHLGNDGYSTSLYI